MTITQSYNNFKDFIPTNGCLKTRSKNKLEHSVEGLILHWLVKQSKSPCNENYKRVIGRILNITHV